MIKHILIYLSKYKHSLQTLALQVGHFSKMAVLPIENRDSEEPGMDPSEVILLLISLPLLRSMVLSSRLL